MSGLILQGAHESEASLFFDQHLSRSALFFFPFISSLFLPRRARRNSLTWNGDFSPKRSSNRRSTAVDEEVPVGGGASAEEARAVADTHFHVRGAGSATGEH